MVFYKIEQDIFEKITDNQVELSTSRGNVNVRIGYLRATLEYSSSSYRKGNNDIDEFLANPEIDRRRGITLLVKLPSNIAASISNVRFNQGICAD